MYPDKTNELKKLQAEIKEKVTEPYVDLWYDGATLDGSFSAEELRFIADQIDLAGPLRP